MSPVTHFLIGWSVGSLGRLSRKERILVAIAGVAPDSDGIGLLFDLASRDSLHGLWSRYHHVLAHNITFGLLLSALACCLATRRSATALLAFASFHLHLLGDLVGSRAPDDIWNIPYLLPFSGREFCWSGQWPLNSWQNALITLAFIAFGLYQGWYGGVSPVEVFSVRGNGQLVQALRGRFGDPRRNP